MEELKRIREKISRCDDKLITVLDERMNCIKDIIEYKKKHGLSIFQPEQEEKQQNLFHEKLEHHIFEDAIMDIYNNVLINSKRIQAKTLFDYNIFLVGFMGAGKTTVTGYLSQMLAMESVETDQIIIDKEDMSIKEIFEKNGEEYFRNCESNALIDIQKKNQMVVSCGGGIVLRDENLRTMKRNGRVVLLTASPETIFDRVKDSTERPLLNNNMNVTYISKLMQDRESRYNKVADIVVNTDNKPIMAVCEELVAKILAFDLVHMDVYKAIE